MRDGQTLRPVDGYFAQAVLPLRIGNDLAQSAFAGPLDRELDRIGLGRVAGFEISQDDEGEPALLTITLSLATDAPRALKTVAQLLEKLDAPMGSRLGNAECDNLLEFGTSEGLGLYLPRQDTAEEDRLAVIEACTDALNGAGLYQGSVSVGDRTALYFYGNSFNRMRTAITYVMTTDPRCRNAFARRLN
ncbi:MAG: hypothetical protein KJO15_09245 [Alphaproteobacteria bacterium]|nr:hypothetical protein [Alphaproteobacteria bacterium]MBT8475706.1 hypothetical protein [Alphaproteobacteria bacterium]